MIPLFKPYMNEAARQNVLDVLTYKDGGLYIGQGQIVEDFEAALKEEFGREVLTVNSATSGLDLALHMIGVMPGDEVITTPITCTATNSPIVNRHAIPVWADVDMYTGLINPYDVGYKITNKTKAIMAVNWGGAMPDYEHLKSFGLPVIEDAAHGPYWSNKSRGDYIIWSFQAIKHLTTGDGGGIFSPDPERARLLRWYGLDRRSSKNFRCEQNITEVGYKYHMNDINAAIGLGNIKDLRKIVAIHQDNAEYYSSVLKFPFDVESSYWLYTIIVEDVPRFTTYMNANGVEVGPVHARNDKHAGFYYPNGDLPETDYFDTHHVSIPVGWWVTQDSREYISHVIRSF